MKWAGGARMVLGLVLPWDKVVRLLYSHVEQFVDVGWPWEGGVTLGGIIFFACMHAMSLQSCPTLCDSMDCCLPGFAVHGILQAGMLEWVAVPFSRVPSQPREGMPVSYGSCIAGRFFTTEPLRKPIVLFDWRHFLDRDLEVSTVRFLHSSSWRWVWVAYCSLLEEAISKLSFQEIC